MRILHIDCGNSCEEARAYAAGRIPRSSREREVPPTTVGVDFESGPFTCVHSFDEARAYAAGRIRTCEGTKPHGPEPCSFGHSDTAAPELVKQTAAQSFLNLALVFSLV